MSIVVWDGHTLATDRAATDGAIKWRAAKAWRFGEAILSGVGPVQSILAMREWYMRGADPADLPIVQLSPNWCHFIVVRKDGLHRYEQGPYPIHHGRDQCAFGEGKDFAYGALAMGADAAKAVEITNMFSTVCGHGVDTYQP